MNPDVLDKILRAIIVFLQVEKLGCTNSSWKRVSTSCSPVLWSTWVLDLIHMTRGKKSDQRETMHCCLVRWWQQDITHGRYKTKIEHQGFDWSRSWEQAITYPMSFGPKWFWLSKDTSSQTMFFIRITRLPSVPKQTVEHCEKSRHIDIQYFFMKDRFKSGRISVVYCPTEEMLAVFLRNLFKAVCSGNSETSF